jgi:anaerobic selenocysteine-containing dehydrogenase
MSRNRDELGSWGNSTVETACPLDCPDSCSLNVTVEKGRVVKIDGSTRQPVTNGYICAKVRGFADHMYGPERLLHPAVRRGRKGSGAFARVSWDEALDLIARRMREIRERWGGEAVLPFYYGGSNGLLTQDTTDADVFRAFGASRLARTVCAAPTGTAALAMYGKMPCVAYVDYPQARLIVVWGTNPSASGIHLVPYIREAQKCGARLVVVDPRRTQLAKLADLHVPVRPGTDLAVALALHRHLFETGRADTSFLAAHTHGAERLREKAAAWTFDRAAAVSGVPGDVLERFAELYAGASPAVIRCGWGLERNRNGGNAVLAILALPAVAGKFGVRGGGYTMSNSGAWPNLPPSLRTRAPEPSTRIVNMNHLGRALTEYDSPPVQMLFVYNCNPAATMPDQNRVLRGLSREDLFTVVFEQVMNDTAAYADVLLPATTFLETYDLARGYGPISLQLARPVVDAVGEARANVEVFSELAERLEIGSVAAESEGEALMRVVGNFPAEISRDLLGSGFSTAACGYAPLPFVDVFPFTPDGKAHLFPDVPVSSAEGLYGFQADPATDQYPLALISPASARTISSTLGQLRRQPASLAMHPDDAHARRLEEGDTVRVFNELGEVHCVLRITPEIRSGTVSLPKGLWRRSTLNGSTANALAPDALSDLGGGACFNDARVDVARVLSASYDGQNVGIFVH